ncbi:hypothetical protein M422DRAFT_249455 [Sphaerobolus stellatus SS14]|uniref:Uncharacterized protein n=1 Tax=Sphaerobolus stellatus (strain SS14) TaxID=990650 RepID=A0A0C9VIK3_SPHS4|nr:hypothetical protein M422DRAFT_249455 [Sphaerobolus stellatus SS14]
MIDTSNIKPTFVPPSKVFIDLDDDGKRTFNLVEDDGARNTIISKSDNHARPFMRSEELWNGSASNIFCVHFSISPSSSQTFVLKVFKEESRASLFTEQAIYEGAKMLQGSILPHWYGLNHCQVSFHDLEEHENTAPSSGFRIIGWQDGTIHNCPSLDTPFNPSVAFNLLRIGMVDCGELNAVT